MVVAMLEFACIILISRKNTLKNSPEKDFVKKSKAKKLVMIKFNRNVHPTWIKEKKEKKEMKFTAPPNHVIDSVAFCVHFLSFLVYNIIYWSNKFQ